MHVLQFVLNMISKQIGIARFQNLRYREIQTFFKKQYIYSKTYVQFKNKKPTTIKYMYIKKPKIYIKFF